MAKRRRKAFYVNTLVYYDEPQVISLDSGKSKGIAVAVPEETEPKIFSKLAVHPFLASVVSPREWDKYIDGAVDLRYLFLYSRKESLFYFDMGSIKEDDSIMMEPIELEDVPDEWLPDPHFFSEDHTEPMHEGQESLTGRQKYYIDGKWGLNDFSRFYGRVSDAYTFELSLDKFMDNNTPDRVKQDVVRAFRHYPFRGGSSYGNFYNDLAGVLSQREQPGVERVKYESPGYVDIRGRQDIFERISHSIINFQNNFLAIKHAYSVLYNHLAGLGYLKASPREFVDGTITAKAIMKEAEKLAHVVKMDNIDVIKELCGRNTLVFAKVVLSYCRRIEGAFDFFAEGRASFTDSAN